MIINSNINGIGGMEFARFKLKQGVTEEKLIALSHLVETEFLTQQDELIIHMLLRGADGNYADVVFASSQQKAEEYCQQWLHNAAALSYLDVIEHGSAQLTFWTRIH
jgi:hypothetical protein